MKRSSLRNCRKNGDRSRSRSRRRGAAAVEFALTVPVLFFIALGCVEMVRYNLVKNVANQAAFEAARVGVVPGATTDWIVAEAENQLEYVCNEADIEVDPPVLTDADNQITVTILIDTSEQGWIMPQFFADPVIEAKFTIQRDSVKTF